MKRDLTKQPFPEDEVTPELISSVTISTLNKWIIELGINFNNLSKAKRHEKEEALLQYLHDREESGAVANNDDSVSVSSPEFNDFDEDDFDDEEELIQATILHVSKKYKTDTVNKVDIVRDTVLVSTTIVAIFSQLVAPNFS
jgi:hypothetical protein